MFWGSRSVYTSHSFGPRCLIYSSFSQRTHWKYWIQIYREVSERNLWTKLVESVKFKLKVGDLNKLASSRLLPRKTNELWCFMLPPLYGNGSLTVWAALNSKPRLTTTACETWLRKLFATSKQHYNKNSRALQISFFKKEWFAVNILKLRTIHNCNLIWPVHRSVYFIDRAKRGLCLDLSCLVWYFVYVCVYLSHDYGHIPLPIVTKLGINVLGTKTKRLLCKDLFISFLFQNVGQFRGSFPQLRASREVYCSQNY